MWTVLTWLTADCEVNQLRGPDPFSGFWHDWNGQMNLIRAGPVLSCDMMREEVP